ncbi:MAG: phage major tail tube protein [Campylobacteraceae bacterium]|nr:phage major tail tube protein [Campylobacteraceae bacterium]
MANIVKLPQKVVDASVFIEGLGFVGRTDMEKIKLPDIELIQETIKAGGFEVDINTGVFKKMEFEVGIKEVNSVIYESYSKALSNGGGMNISIKASLIQEGNKVSVVIDFRAIPTISNGLDEITLKGTTSLFKYVVGGKELCLLDSKYMIGKIMGVDYLEALRSHIM